MKHFNYNLRNIRFTPEGLFILTLFTISIPNLILSFTEHPGVFGKITNTVLPVALYMLLLSSSRKVGRTVWLMFPLIFFAAFQIVLLDLYGRSVIAVDMFLNLVTTNPSEAFELLDNLWPVIIVVCVLYLPVLVWASIAARRRRRLSERFTDIARRIALAMSTLGLVFLGLSYMTDSDYSVRRDLYPVNVVYNLGQAIDRTVKVNNYYNTSAGFTYNAVPTHDPDERELYILVVGETSRADNWSLFGYDRLTNPRLANVDSLYAFGLTLSESNTTHKSVPMLLSPLTSATFNKGIYTTKSLVTAFKEAGFHTVFLSNQRYNGSFIDFFANEADSTVFIKEGENMLDNPSDIDLLPIMNDVIGAGRKKQLIVLHTYGSHFNYNERYHDIDRRFTPDDIPEASAGYRDNLINAYDNSIVATDRLLADIIATVDSMAVKGAVVYTSDHGEDIFDDSRGLFLHASPCPSIHQIHVPFLVWLSRPYRNAIPEAAEALVSNLTKPVSSSTSFFHTALGISGIDTEYYDPTLSLTSKSYTHRPTRYLDDHNRSVTLDQAGFTREDIKGLENLNRGGMARPLE